MVRAIDGSMSTKTENTYAVKNLITGNDLGAYVCATPEAALDAMADATGFPSLAAMCEFYGERASDFAATLLVPVCAKVTTKMQLIKAMRLAGLTGEVSGAGKSFGVVLADDNTYNAFNAMIPNDLGGYGTGFGGWCLSTNYVDRGDPADPFSAHHY